MDRDDEFRRNAAEAQGWADKAKSEDDRAAWLRIAQGWLGLLRNAAKTKSELFEEQSSSLGTGQERSDQRH